MAEDLRPAAYVLAYKLDSHTARRFFERLDKTLQQASFAPPLSLAVFLREIGEWRFRRTNEKV